MNLTTAPKKKWARYYTRAQLTDKNGKWKIPATSLPKINKGPWGCPWRFDWNATNYPIVWVYPTINSNLFKVEVTKTEDNYRVDVGSWSPAAGLFRDP